MKRINVYIVVILLCVLCSCSKKKLYGERRTYYKKGNYCTGEISKDKDAFYTMMILNDSDFYNISIALLPYKYALEADFSLEARRIF